MPVFNLKWRAVASLALPIVAAAVLVACQGPSAGPPPAATTPPPTAPSSPPPAVTKAPTPKPTVATTLAPTPAPARTPERTPPPPPPATTAAPKPAVTTPPATTVPPKPAVTTPPAATAPAPGAGDPQRGRTVYTNLGCGACHGPEAQGGFGPVLIGKAAPLIKDVVRHGSEPGMPAFDAAKLSDADLDNIVAFLTQRTPASPPPATTAPGTPATPKPAATTRPAPASPPPATPPPAAGAADPQRGKTVYANLGCGACHGPEAQGGFGPALVGKAAPLIKDVTRHGSEPGMPAFGADRLSDADLDNLVAFLTSLK